MSNKIDRAKVFLYLRLAVGVVLLIILVKIIDVHQMSLIVVSAQPHFIVMGFLVILCNFLLKTYRWASILWVQEPDISFARLVRFNLISTFLSNFLPGSMSSDIIKIYQVSKYTSKINGAISSIVADRIIGNFSTAIVTVIAFIALQQTDLIQLGSLFSYGIFGFLLLSVGAPLALQNRSLIAGMRKFLSRYAGIKLFERVREMYEGFLLYQNKYRLMLKALSISFLNLVIAIFEFYVVAMAFSAETPIGYYLIFVPLAIFLAMLPVSLGGIGVMEAAMVFFFSTVGMPAEMCLSIVLVRRALLLLSSLPGGMLYVLEGFPVNQLSFERKKSYHYW